MKILITGASSGIGAELAREYAYGDNELILLARRADKLYDLRKELYEKCKSVEVIVADVTEFHKLQEKLKVIDRVDTIVLNAGVSLGHSKATPTIDEFKKIYDVNVLANHAILEVLLPKLEEQGYGKIVFISSLASLISMPTSKVYSSSKRALNAYAEGIRYKYKAKHIKVLTILPGFIKSELTDKNDFDMPFILDTKVGAQKIRRAIEAGREFYAFPFRFYALIKLLKFLPNFLREKIIDSINKSA